MLNRADALQDKTEESLQHTRQMVDATKDVAVATLEELHRQRWVNTRAGGEGGEGEGGISSVGALERWSGSLRWREGLRVSSAVVCS